MKYKKIIEDKDLAEKVRSQNIAELARNMGVSKSYMYMMLKGDFAVTEDFYLRLKKIIQDKLNSYKKNLG